MAQQMNNTSFQSSNRNTMKDKKTVYVDKIALANRPLSTSSLHNSPAACGHCSSHIRPASFSNFKSNNGNDLLKPGLVNKDNNYSHEREEPISVIMKKDNHSVSVLLDDSDYYIGDYTTHEMEKMDYISSYSRADSNKVMDEKIDILTQFYIGSISVVALFLVYRILQK